MYMYYMPCSIVVLYFSGIIEEGGSREHAFGLVTAERTYHLTAETNLDKKWDNMIYMYVTLELHVGSPLNPCKIMVRFCMYWVGAVLALRRLALRVVLALALSLTLALT